MKNNENLKSNARNKAKSKNVVDTISHKLEGGKAGESRPNRGFHFPRIAIFFIIIGILSEVVDALMLKSSLAIGAGGLEPWQAYCVSAIIGATCFASMAFVGYQRGRENRSRLSLVAERVGFGTWLAAGIALVIVRILVEGQEVFIMMFDGMPFAEIFSDNRGKRFLSMFFVALLQLVLYIGTGFLTRDSAEILSDNNIWEYKRAKKHYRALLKGLTKRRSEIRRDISILKVYPTYAKRLAASKKSIKENISQYNESVRAMIEAKMAANTEPDLMRDMYDKAMLKGGHAPSKEDLVRPSARTSKN